jgi:hypothetical protein
MTRWWPLVALLLGLGGAVGVLVLDATDATPFEEEP